MPILVAKIVRNTYLFYYNEIGKTLENEYDSSIKQTALIGAAIALFSIIS